LKGTSPWIYIPAMFLSNVIVAWVALEIARTYSRREREKVEGRNQPGSLVEIEAAHQ
jgi:hypothetical protein